MSEKDMTGSNLTFHLNFSEVESDGARLAEFIIETQDSVVKYWMMDYDVKALSDWMKTELKKKPKSKKGIRRD